MAAAAQEVTLIGLCDGQLDDNKDRPTFLTNKVGGRPDWLPDISRQSPRCRCCGAPLVHVVQVYCPLDASPYHRNLHLFACPGPGCSGRPEGWTVLRSQGLEAEARTVSRPEPPQEAPLSATDWCDGADDWGVEEDGWGGGGEEAEGEVPEEAPGGGGGSISARSNIIITIFKLLSEIFITRMERMFLSDSGSRSGAPESCSDWLISLPQTASSLSAASCGGCIWRRRRARPPSCARSSSAWWKNQIWAERTRSCGTLGSC